MGNFKILITAQKKIATLLTNINVVTICYRDNLLKVKYVCLSNQRSRITYNNCGCSFCPSWPKGNIWLAKHWSLQMIKCCAFETSNLITNIYFGLSCRCIYSTLYTWLPFYSQFGTSYVLLSLVNQFSSFSKPWFKR